VAKHPIALVITAEPAGFYNGWYMHLNGHPIGHKPYDGSDGEKACDEVLGTLTRLVGERLGWSAEVPENDEDD